MIRECPFFQENYFNDYEISEEDYKRINDHLNNCLKELLKISDIIQDNLLKELLNNHSILPETLKTILYQIFKSE